MLAIRSLLDPNPWALAQDIPDRDWFMPMPGCAVPIELGMFGAHGGYSDRIEVARGHRHHCPPRCEDLQCRGYQIREHEPPAVPPNHHPAAFPERRRR